MRFTFFGLEIARRGLQAQQRALDVTSHNIANANTPGFTRQEAVLATTPPFPLPSLSRPWGAGQLGTGVEVTEIRRLRDRFLDLQVRHETQALGYWEARRDALRKVEVIFNEPSESGLRTVFEQFWQALEELSKNPESLAARSVVRQRALALTDTFNHMDRQLAELQADLNNAVAVKVDEVNSIARQIASLNDQILKIEVTGERANDLRDRRDLLVDNLSRLVDVQVTEDERELLQVVLGGRPLVQGNIPFALKVEEDAANDGFFSVLWETGDEVLLTGGTLKGLVEMRDSFVRDIRDKLDTLAQVFATRFNEVHGTGYDLNGDQGGQFFVFTDPQKNGAGTISVNDQILGEDGLTKIAAAAAPPPGEEVNKGDGSNALALAQLKYALLEGLGKTTFEDYLRSIIGQLGVAAQEANRMVENQELLVDQLESNRQAVVGVSLDEEMVNMIRFQHAYSAAARLITTLDELLEIVIERMGLVGR